MRKTYRYRVYGNAGTLANLGRWLDLCRDLYNCALEQRREAWRYWHRCISYYDQQNELPVLKKEFPEYKEVDAQCLRYALLRLEWAFRAFIRRGKRGGNSGYPRFKGKHRYNSITLVKNSWRLEDNRLYIRNMGVFKLKLSRPLEGDIKTVTLRRMPTGKWHVCFCCDKVPEKKLPQNDRAVGIDVGIHVFCVDSDGGRFDNPQYYREAQKVLRMRQRRLCRRKKGGANRNKARILVAKSHEKVANQRKDYLHKVANHYIQNYGRIFVETLQIGNMVKNRHLSKSIQDSGWGLFFTMLNWKAEEAAREVYSVNPFNTSQICSGCGEKVPKALSQRTHACPHCGLVLDRDENAALNILAAGQAVRAETKEVTLSVARESPNVAESVKAMN